MIAREKVTLPASPEPAVSAGWTVFVVDDDVDDLALNRRVLEKSPHIEDVVCVSSADRLFAELHARYFFYDVPHSPPNSMIVLDIHMPGTDGICLLEQLKSSPYTEKIPVIIVSGDDRTRNIQDVHDLNACGFLTKPLYAENLENIHAVMEKGRDWRTRGLEESSKRV